MGVTGPTRNTPANAARPAAPAAAPTQKLFSAPAAKQSEAAVPDGYTTAALTGSAPRGASTQKKSRAEFASGPRRAKDAGGASPIAHKAADIAGLLAGKSAPVAAEALGAAKSLLDRLPRQPWPF
jgi:hypothetical protein